MFRTDDYRSIIVLYNKQQISSEAQFYRIDENMDDIFKSWIIDIGFSRSPQFEIDWTRQVLNINQYWDMLIDDIDRVKFAGWFRKECGELNLDCEDYDMELAFENALSNWRIELMISVANMIAQFFTDEIPNETKLVTWNAKTKKPEFIYKLLDT